MKYERVNQVLKNGNLTDQGQIIKSNLSWSPTWAKFCELIASLCVWFYSNSIW